MALVLKKAVPFWYILIRQERGEKSWKISVSVFETEEIIEIGAEKQQASLKSFFSFCVLWPFCCKFKNKTLQVDMGIEPIMVLWFRSKIQSESLQLSKVFIDT